MDHRASAAHRLDPPCAAALPVGEASLKAFPTTDYGQELARGLSLSGESAEYFARERVNCVLRLIARQRAAPGRILEFGCGTGTNLPFLRDAFPRAVVCGIDSDPRLLDLARGRFGQTGIEFLEADAWERKTWDLIYVNGVFHHIPPQEQPRWIKRMCEATAPCGNVALFENNPLNPGARLVMRRIPFDRDAIMLWPRSLRRMALDAGYVEPRLCHLFVFPRCLSWLRPLERLVSWAPAGAQYCLFASRKP